MKFRRTQSAMFCFLILIMAASVLHAAVKSTSAIKLVVDGLDLQTVNPIISEGGNVYVSIADLEKVMGKSVKFDPRINTVVIGKTPAQAAYLSEMKPLNYQVYGNELEMNCVQCALAGNTFNKALSFQTNVKPTSEKQDAAWVDFNLDQKYARLTGKLGVNDSFLENSDHNAAVFSFAIVGDGSILKEWDGIRVGDFPKDVDIDISNVVRLRLIVLGVTSKYWTSAYVTFADMAVTSN